ncbi:MAG: SET domain-containing protein-lysine N-methyltransferase [Rhodospirillales bacterium]
MQIQPHAIVRPLVFDRPQSKLRQYKYLYVAPAGPCGFGLFTARSFGTGSIVLDVRDVNYLANVKPYAQLILLGYSHADVFQVGPDLFLPPYGGLDDFTNHSCEPNCGLRVDPSGFDMIALRDIAAGEELTYDYSTHQEHPEEDMVCHCGTPSCRGTVRSFSQLPSYLRRRYLDLGIVASFIREREGRAPTGG